MTASLFIAQTLIGFYFIFFGVWNVYHWTRILRVMTELNIPHPYLLLPIGIAWQVIAGGMIFCSFYAHLAALSLIPFTLVAAVIFHPFWKFTGEVRILNITIFVTNVTVVLGALLLLLH